MQSLDQRIEKALNGRTPKARIVILDRSRVEAREKCPWLRHLHYHIPVMVDRIGAANGMIPVAGSKTVYGIMRKAAAIPLVTGITMHHGLALILQGADEDTAVRESIKEYDKILETRGFQQQNDTPLRWIAREQRALGEGLIRAANRRAAQKILQNFEILAVEEEILAWLGDVEDDRGGVTFLWAGRLDALLRDKQGFCVVLNWKTQKKWYDTDAAKLRLDMQTVGEAWAASEYYGLPVSGVQYVFMIKGEQRTDPDKNFKVTYNHLTRAWRTLGEMGSMKYAWRYYKEGTRQQVLSKGMGFFTFEDYPGGVGAWVDHLDEGLIHPVGEADPLMDLLRTPPAVSAGAAKIERWREQTLRDEHRWLLDLEDGRPPSRYENGFNCGAGDWKCQMYEICHEGEEPLTSERFLPRDPNHPVELSIWES